MQKVKVLFLARDLPYPDNSGYRKRNFFFLRELWQRGFDVTLLAPDPENGTAEARAGLEKYCQEIIAVPIKKRSRAKALLKGLFLRVPFIVEQRRMPELLRAASNYLKNNTVDIIVCDSVFRAVSIPFDFKGYKVLYEHNIESLILRRYISASSNLLRRFFALLEFVKLQRFEQAIWAKFDCTIACSEADKRLMLTRAPGIKVAVINNGVDCDFFCNGKSNLLNPNAIVYTGQIGWYPNEDAVLYFTQRIFPLVKKEAPEAVLWIVGNAPSRRVLRLAKADASIKVTGFVEDVRPYIASARVYIAPIRIAAGTRLKILEALSMQKPVVSTSIGCEGLEVKDAEHLLIRDDAQGFAKAVTQILKDNQEFQALGANGRKLVREKYDWRVVFKGFSLGERVG